MLGPICWADMLGRYVGGTRAEENESQESYKDAENDF